MKLFLVTMRFWGKKLFNLRSLSELWYWHPDSWKSPLFRVFLGQLYIFNQRKLISSMVLTVNQDKTQSKNYMTQEPWVQSPGWEGPLWKGTATHSSILAWEFHEQRSLADYSLWGHKEPDTTEQLTFPLERIPSVLLQSKFTFLTLIFM